MGAFFTNIQVRGDDAQSVVAAMRKLGCKRASVSPSHNGWVSVYEQNCEKQDLAILQRIAMGLSRACQSAVIAFMVHDSDVLFYLLYEKGQLADEYDSNPDYFRRADADTRQRYRGQPQVLLPLCVAGTSTDDITAALDPSQQGAMAEEALIHLASLLGIDETRVRIGFNDLKEEVAATPETFEHFHFIGAKPKPRKLRKETTAVASLEQRLEQFDGAIATLFCSSASAWEMFAMTMPTWPAGKPLPPEFEQAAKKLRRSFQSSARQTLAMCGLPDSLTEEELFAAFEDGNEPLAKLLADRAPERLAGIAWFVATMCGSPQPLAALLDVGVDPNGPGRHDRTLLMAAAGSEMVENVPLLLARGASVNTRDSNGKTALGHASQRPGNRSIGILQAAGGTL